MKNNTRENAAGKWRGILLHFGLTQKQLNGNHQACPMCGGKDRWRYSDHDGNGSYFCSGCGPGSGFDLLMGLQDWDYARTAREVDHMLGTIPEDAPFKPKVDVEKRRRDLNAIWKAASKDYGFLSEYFHGRGIDGLTQNLLRDIRYHPSMFLTGSSLRHAGMIALVRNKSASPVSIHRTYFSPKTRKMMPPTETIKGAAIRLGLPVDDTLVIGEGIETTLAGCVEFGAPGFAAISANMMEEVWVPPTVKELIILADNDHSFTGQKAAFTLARRHALDGMRVKVIISLETGEDYNDVVRQPGGTVVEFNNEE